MRARVCAAILHQQHILMVRHEHDGLAYWTLPGGGVEPGETFEAAVIREVREETRLRVRVVRFLFEELYLNGISYCYLAELDGDANPQLGADPEEAHLPAGQRMLRAVAWLPLEEQQEDRQVSKVLLALQNPGAIME